jgi:hypothetical protein
VSVAPSDAIARSDALLAAARAGDDDAALVCALAEVDPSALDGAARTAFWLNVYNARVKTAVRARGLRGDLRRHRGFFRETSWIVGGREVSLHVMEHGLLRANRRAPYTLWRPLADADPRRAWAAERLDPRVHFALNCGALSCPPIRAYAAERLDEQLALATRSYFDGEVAIEGDTLRLPYLCALYRADFPDLLPFVAAHVDEARAAWIRARPGARVRWGPYRWEIGGE